MKTTLLAASIFTSMLLASCSSGPNARTGTLIGGLGGAAAGGIIGNQSGRGLEGAVVEGVLGSELFYASQQRLLALSLCGNVLEAS